MPAPAAAPAPTAPGRAQRFTYREHHFDPDSGRLVCRYAVDATSFEELITFAPARRPVDEAALEAAARLVFLLAGVSYYKTGAPPLIEVPGGLRNAERALLYAFYLEGLGEFAYRNGVDMADLRIEAPRLPDPEPRPGETGGGVLVPFGGGLDSIVTVEGLRPLAPDMALFVVSRDGDLFDAIEVPAAVTGLPVVRAERRIDDKVLRSAELGYLTGHVPVTGILSAVAVMAAILDGRDAVAMSNEWSASSGNLDWNGMTINHQWSKSRRFEDLFRDALAGVPAAPDYFSWLRPRSELWVARRFVDLPRYHRAFRSCNRAFYLDRSHRFDRWCGRCDKCCFIDLILAPFMSAAELETIFDRNEPLQQPDLLEQFRLLLGLGEGFKPFECVGDIDESRAAAVAAAARPDRAGNPILASIAGEAGGAAEEPESFERLLQPLGGGHNIPARYAPPDLLD